MLVIKILQYAFLLRYWTKPAIQGFSGFIEVSRLFIYQLNRNVGYWAPSLSAETGLGRCLLQLKLLGTVFDPY